MKHKKNSHKDLYNKNPFSTFLKNNYFLSGLILKVIFSCIFASTYLSDLFIPFAKIAIHDGLWNAYKEYIHINPIAFPYPPVMLYIMALPAYIASLISGGSMAVSSLDIFLARMPLLIADIGIALVLASWLKNTSSVLKWYWLNPVVIYISYIHGQLDIIPTAFLCVALYALFIDRLWTFVVFLALACATKFHVAITIPLLLIYLIKTKKVSIPDLFKGATVFMGLLLLLNCPFIFQPEYIKMVYQNEEQGKVLASTLSIFGQYQVVLIPACYMVLLYLIISFNFINKDILLIFLALSFGMITFFIVPGQGWYMWNMPFLIYFIIRFRFKGSATFVILNSAYFSFFIIYPKSDFPLVAQFIQLQWREVNNLYTFLSNQSVTVDKLVQLSFTFLQTALFLQCVSVFRTGVLKIRGYKIYHHPYLIGIGGDSGTGKSVLSDSLQQLFGVSNTVVVHGDDMHRWERGHEKWNTLTHLNPQANWLHKDLSQLMDLKAGRKIFRRHYDHNTGKFTKPYVVQSNKIVIYEGLHTFYLKGASVVYDLKIFLKPSEALRRYWKVKRDVNNRGYDSDKVLESIEKRMGDSLSHILNQEESADIVFSIINRNRIVAYENTTDTDLDMQLLIICSNDTYFEHLIGALRAKTNLAITHHIDHSKQNITVSGQIQGKVIEDLAFTLGLDIEDLTGVNPVWADDFLGLMQFFLLYQMIMQLRRDDVFLRADNTSSSELNLGTLPVVESIKNTEVNRSEFFIKDGE